MILHSFSLENFRQYLHNQEIRFSYDKDERINTTVIRGSNGSGKTSLFSAINWCLYGFKAINNISSLKLQSEEELFCKEAIKRAAPGERIVMSATLAFSHHAESYRVSRSKGAIKNADGTISLEKEYKFTINKICIDGQTIVMNSDKKFQTDPEEEIRKVLAEEASRYFFFDGERIDAITRPDSEQVSIAMNSIFKIDLLCLCRKRLKRLIEHNYEHRISVMVKNNAEAQKLIADLNKQRDNLQLLEKRKDDLLDELRQIDKHIENLNKDIEEKISLNAHFEKMKAISRSIEERHLEINELARSVQKDAAEAYLVLAGPMVRKACSLLEKRGALGYVSQDFVYTLLTEQRCICGRPLEKDGPEYQHLQALLQEATLAGPSNQDSSLITLLRSLAQEGRGKLDLLLRDQQQYENLSSAIMRLYLERDQIQDKLHFQEETDIGELSKKLKRAYNDRERVQIQLRDIEVNIDQVKKSIKDIEGKIELIEKKSPIEDLLITKYKIASKVRDAIDEIVIKYKEEIRDSVGKNTSDIFGILLWKENYFRQVTLDEKFNLEVVDRYGKPALQDLSSGERQVLSLAFIIAMSRLSQEEAPLMMDTPFGRLSAENRANIAKHVPGLTHQLILLVTDEELDDHERLYLEPYIGREYDLHFDSRTGCTTIVEVQK